MRISDCSSDVCASDLTPFVIHQPSYSLLNRWIEDELLATLEEVGIGCIVFSPLAQGVLTNRYLEGIPEGARAATRGTIGRAWWRERVCQYVLISVVADSLKKKPNDNTVLIP